VCRMQCLAMADEADVSGDIKIAATARVVGHARREVMVRDPH
jgi:hypothetical protein